MQSDQVAHRWDPIADLPEGWQDLSRDDLHVVHRGWLEEKSILKDPRKIDLLEGRLRTEWAIETGIIERLYTVDRGVTETLIELGLEAIGQAHHRGKISENAVKLIEDQAAALDFVFQFIRQDRPFSLSYVKELHQLLTRNQLTCEAVDQFGNMLEVELLKGDWKKLPNNPVLPDGRIHEYCPPDFVLDEMEQLLKWYGEHAELRVDVEIEAAWLHHRFTQIHPFQDGNGRVARALSTMIFLRDSHLPLVIRDVRHRESYLDALERADSGDLGPLTNLFADIQMGDLEGAIDFLRELRGQGIAQIAKTAAERVKLRQKEEEEEVEQLTEVLVGVAEARLQEIAAELRLGFERQGLEINVDVRRNVPDTQNYWGFQIVETAKHYGYWADLGRFRAWVSLRMRLPELGQGQTHIVISLHHGGYATNLMTAVAFLTRTASTETGADVRQGWEVVPATGRPHTYSTTHRDPESFFRDWLETAIEEALNQWQSKL